ncbi:MAG TPA: DUF3568 family protein [Candidatus Saccharimonadia bacterium]|nr:DUF3568 family protein [Candidatus Saccharimonadia bacterium]
MRRYLYALLGMSLLASVSGCVTTAVGGGPNVTTGTYSYFTRELEVIYGIPLADVWPRVLAAVESLQLHIDRQTIDGLGGEIQARRADGTKVRVDLKPSGNHSTSVSVRVGDMGDREMSERVQRTIREQVGI